MDEPDILQKETIMTITIIILTKGFLVKDGTCDKS